MLDYALPFMLAAFCIAVLVRLALYKVTPPKIIAANYGRDDGLDDVQPTKPNITFERIKREEATARKFGQRTVPPVRKPTISLTPRMIERVNTQRKLRGMPPLNRTGIKAAVSTAALDTHQPQPQSSNDWLTYLILYECFFADHQSHTVGGVGGFTIDPNLPYNGQGGEYSGAGASGDWSSDPVAATAAADIATGANSPLVSDSAPSYSSDPTPGLSSSPDPAPSYTPDPTPSYSAPDPSPSYSSSDSSSSYSSSDSYSSSSSDSGSSSSGGGDGS